MTAALILCTSVFGCSRNDQSKKTLLLISGWSVSPDFQKLVVPFWIGHLNEGSLRGAAPTELQASYQYLVVFDLTAKGQFRFLPFTGDAPDALPDYLGSFTSWSADSEKLFYYGGWRWNSDGPRLWHPSRIDLKTGAANQSD
ncbi:MAG TPA: hypothetical protein VHX68_18050, partial [Planctomycetaceae bacterium]|nr:hypothetical protein [Planctomycetaceae bacterium]